jgi:Cu2+-exporting ATPase
VVVGAPAFVAARLGPDGGAHGGAGGTGDPAAAALAGAPGVAPPPAPDGLTPVWVAVDGALAARAAFGDRVRPDARAALDALRGRGWSVGLLSGDDPAVARAVGRELGFADADARGGASPEDKRRAVEDAATRGPVVMVGDGVNDAAAIARATVGVGVHGGAEASLAAADVYLSRPGAAELVALADGAARTLAVIRRNIAFSLAYNVVGAALAMAGLVHPLVAAVLMPASSLTVVIASWKSRTFGGGPR